MDAEELTAKRLRLLRTTARLSQGALAARAGCSQAFISSIEQGHGHPSPEMSARLLAALTDADPDVLQGSGLLETVAREGQPS